MWTLWHLLPSRFLSSRDGHKRCPSCEIQHVSWCVIQTNPPCLRCQVKKNLIFRLERSELSTSYKLRKRKINQLFEKNDVMTNAFVSIDRYFILTSFSIILLIAREIIWGPTFCASMHTCAQKIDYKTGTLFLYSKSIGAFNVGIGFFSIRSAELEFKESQCDLATAWTNRR